MTADIRDTVRLSNGVMMPRLGLGTYKSAEGGDVERAVAHALKLGYRHIDTASFYGNEAGIGRAIADSGVPRDELFVATKVWNDEQGYDATLTAFEHSLMRLDAGYIDLYLVHWPRPETPETWRAMERLLTEGRVRAIGVCNHLTRHLEALLREARIAPVVNQFEMHPWLKQPDLLEACRSNGIVAEAWSPLMRGRAAEEPVLVRIGARHRKSAAQVAIRWALQHDVVVIPKSVTPSRIAENADVFDFELTGEDMREIDAIPHGERLGPHPDRFPAR